MYDIYEFWAQRRLSAAAHLKATAPAPSTTRTLTLSMCVGRVLKNQDLMGVIEGLKELLEYGSVS